MRGAKPVTGADPRGRFLQRAGVPTAQKGDNGPLPVVAFARATNTQRCHDRLKIPEAHQDGGRGGTGLGGPGAHGVAPVRSSFCFQSSGRRDLGCFRAWTVSNQTVCSWRPRPYASFAIWDGRWAIHEWSACLGSFPTDSYSPTASQNSRMLLQHISPPNRSA